MKIQGRIEIHSLIQELKFRTKFLPKVSWGSPSGFQISLAASLLGATGLIFAFKDGKVGNFVSFGLPWSSSDDGGNVTSDKNWLVPGLQNLGNNCFLNVILQALASCSSFQRFLENIFEEYSILESAKGLPLTAALGSVLEGLCTVQHGRSVLSPRKVMVAMDHYMPSFNLTSQQDAEEAFFHLLSSLREELSEYYIPECSSLADVTATHNYKILTPKKKLKESEQQRWRRSFIGPFDGILGSILTCQSCSFQMSGCSLEGCLSQFFVSEKLDNYFCNHCWHVAAIKYLSVKGEDLADIEKLKLCGEDDLCGCKNLCSLQPLPWSNSFSRCFKQLSIARSPQILCVHLQRASVNPFGELVKLLGHISFPLILNLTPFIKRRLGIKNFEENLQTVQGQSHYQLPFPCQMRPSVEFDIGLVNCHGQTRGKVSMEAEVQSHQQTGHELPKIAHALNSWPNMIENGGSADFMMQFMPIHSDNKVDGPSTSTPSKDHMYRLVSVVQHFGRVGSGHYTVYRRVKAETSDEKPIDLLEPTHAQWFCISDSDVHCVSEKDVLGAEASLLFYEKIH